jgi:hypothetical protein
VKLLHDLLEVRRIEQQRLAQHRKSSLYAQNLIQLLATPETDRVAQTYSVTSGGASDIVKRDVVQRI